jgi:hypothetical protein
MQSKFLEFGFGALEAYQSSVKDQLCALDQRISPADFDELWDLEAENALINQNLRSSVVGMDRMCSNRSISKISAAKELLHRLSERSPEMKEVRRCVQDVVKRRKALESVRKDSVNVSQSSYFRAAAGKFGFVRWSGMDQVYKEGDHNFVLFGDRLDVVCSLESNTRSSSIGRLPVGVFVLNKLSSEKLADFGNGIGLFPGAEYYSTYESPIEMNNNIDFYFILAIGISTSLEGVVQ